MKRPLQRLALLLIALLALGPALAAELTALRREQRVGARLQDLDYPASLRKDLVSGLTNRLLIRIRLQREDRLLEEAAIQVAIRYDLWDEVFHVTTTTPFRETSRTEASLEATLRSLADLYLADVFALPQAIGAQQTYPGRQVISLSGDGGIAMLLGDLLSLKQLQLPVKIIVFRNDGLHGDSLGLAHHGPKIGKPGSNLIDARLVALQKVKEVPPHNHAFWESNAGPPDQFRQQP